MTPAQKAKMEAAEKEYSELDFKKKPFPTFEAGYTAALKEAQVLVEALEEICLARGSYDKIICIVQLESVNGLATIALKAFKGDEDDRRDENEA